MASPDLEAFRFDAAIAIARQKRSQNRIDEAADYYRRAMAIVPRGVDAPRELGEMLHAASRLADACKVFEAALSLRPDDYGLNFALGNALSAMGDTAAAERHYKAAVLARPDSAIAHNNLGYMQRLRGDADAAVVSFNEAILLSPALSLAHCNLADLYLGLGRLDLAEQAARRALSVDESSSTAQFILGRALDDQQRTAEAIDVYAEGLKRFPNEARFASFLAGALYRIGEVEAALANYERARAIAPDDRVTQSNILLMLNYRPRDAAEIFAAHEAWGRASSTGPSERPPLPQMTGRSIRVGYVSADFYNHPVGQLIEPVIVSHDRSAFAVFCYYNGDKRDDLTARLVASGITLRQIERASDDEVVRQIQADGIDLLVDLAGHTGGNRLGVFARRAAPVQATYLGYPNTTGLRSIDYRITSSVADPPGLTDRFNTETLVRLPDTFLCAPPLRSQVPIVAPPVLRSGRFTFGCFNNLAKVTPETMALWGRLLAVVPQADLFVKAAPLADAAIRARWVEKFAAHGIAAERLRLSGRLGFADHLAAYNAVDLALDPFPYNGTATSLEGLWMGVPFVTLVGRSHVARVGASLLKAVDLDMLIAEDEGSYVTIAAGMVERPDVLATLRSGMRERLRGSGIGDPVRFTRALETAYREMLNGRPERQNPDISA